LFWKGLRWLSQNEDREAPSEPFSFLTLTILWGKSSELYFKIDELLNELANPNLHDIPMRLPFRVEMWTDSEQIRWVISASSSVTVGHASLDAAIKAHPGQRFTLRNGIQVIREYSPAR
jgi:hypothetical protein